MAYAFNAFIYVRNLVLIHREDQAAPGSESGSAPVSPKPEAEAPVAGGLE